MVENFRWMENMLNAMNDHGPRRVLRNIYDALHAQEIVTTHCADHIEPSRKPLR